MDVDEAQLVAASRLQCMTLCRAGGVTTTSGVYQFNAASPELKNLRWLAPHRPARPPYFVRAKYLLCTQHVAIIVSLAFFLCSDEIAAAPVVARGAVTRRQSIQPNILHL